MDTDVSQLNSVLETVVEGIITINEKGLIEMFNPAAENIFGYKASEIIGKSVNDLMPDPYKSEHDTYITNYLKTGKAKIIGIGREVVGLKKCGTTFPMYLAVSQFFIDDVSKFTGMIRDITLQKQIEKEKDLLLQSVQRANEELKDFAYIVSHDLKAPLRGISSLTQWLVEDYAEQLDEPGQEHAHLIIERTKKMHQLIDGILEYSQVGRDRLKIIPLNSADIAQQVVGSFDIPEGIDIQIIPPLPEVLYHKTHLIQLFQNLISNAITHMGEPGNKILISCADAGNYWEFCIKDNGIGIAENYQERIFKVFQTLNSSYEDKSTGIGLSIVKKIAETHGGEIRVESSEGEGSSFFFTIIKHRNLQ